MMTELHCDEENLPDDVSVLKTTIEDLRRREKQLLQCKEQSEIEFGQRRAKFKELYLAREDELAKEQEKLKIAQEDAKKLENELNHVTDECNGYRAAAAFAESSQKEELLSLHNKYQEEIASLQHIMSEAVREAHEGAAEQFELEKHNLMAQNQKLENEIRNLKALLSSDGNGSSRPGRLSGLSDAVVGAIRRNTATGQAFAGDEEAVNVDPKSLEKSMEKAQEDAEAWRSIVMPLEEEILSLRRKLQDLQDKLQIAEAKIKESESKNQDRNFESDESLSREKFDEMQEKVKELSQYLEAERSSRTDLEMYVAVLNTQKGVLQEDTEKIRKELHNVCRLLEQEKMAHNDLKHTWEMANLQFVENLRVQKEAFTRVWNILTPEQRITAQEKQQEEPQVGQLIDLQSPKSSPQPTNEQPSLNRPSAVVSYGPKWNNIPTVPCTNQVMAESDGVTATLQDDKEGGLKRSHSASDVKLEVETDSSEVSRAHSVEELPNTPPEPDKPSSSSQPRPHGSSKGIDSKVDWKVFQEAVKVSHKGDLSRMCAMCVNYERQLQQMQDDNQKYQNLASNLQVALDQEKKELFKEQKMRNKLEESVARAAEDAQMQINAHKMTNGKLEKLLAGLSENFEAVKHRAQEQIAKLVSSRDQLTHELNGLRTKYAALQDTAMQQLTHMDSDARLTEMREQLMQIRTASENTEQKLRSEVTFLKDRVMAEQLAKDSLEAMLQGDVDNMRTELDKLMGELGKERSAKEKAESQLRKSSLSEKSTDGMSRQVIIALRGQLDETTDEKCKVEEENRRLKNRLQSMTEQLNESETVQRDFVRLSQSLQMQIAQIHESETDVRWQYPEDITECRNCNKGFKSSKEKHHCHHCGKVFCESCTSKSVLGGKPSRPHRVCDNCYVILSKDSKSTFYNTSLADDKR